MEKIIYIQPDEEVTSLVSRLRRVEENRIILVIPQRSMILESFINLQLLQKELQRKNKHLIIITQDERGAEFVGRAGIEVESHAYLQGKLKQGEGGSEQREHQEPQKIKEDRSAYQPKNFIEQPVKKQEAVYNNKEEELQRHLPPQKQPSMQTQQRQSLGGVQKRSLSSDGIRSPREKQYYTPKTQQRNEQTPIQIATQEQSFREGVENASQREYPREKYEDPLFVQNTQKENSHEEKQQEGIKQSLFPKNTSFVKKIYGKEERHISFGRNGVKKSIIAGLFVIGLGMAFWLGWRYIPEAKLTVEVARKEVSEDMNFLASVSGGVDILPLRIVTESVSLTESFPSTGFEDSNTQKSGGIVTLYNGYSEESQPLVATTRLLTEDGKLYRLVESVIIPGKNGEEPGAIDVEVKADESGQEYNIEPTRFSIPGFQGTPKYDSFYALSNKAFVGGGSEGMEVQVVSKEDIAKAQEEMEDRVRTEAIRRMKENAQNGRKVMEETLEVVVEKSDAFPGAGVATETFEYSVTAMATGMEIDENILQERAQEELKAQIISSYGVSTEGMWIPEKTNIEYGKVTPDYDQQKLDMKVFATVMWKANVKAEEFKQEILGMNRKEIEELLNQRNTIEGVVIEIRPEALFSRVSTQSSRVEVVIE